LSEHEKLSLFQIFVCEKHLNVKLATHYISVYSDLHT